MTFLGEELDVDSVAAFTKTQKKALAIVPKVTAWISIIGSTWIISEVLRDRKKHRSTYNRIMGIMSIYDLINSFFLFLSSWPVPADTSFEAKPYGAVGNQTTCTIQGFFIQVTNLKVLYNGVLAVYYLLIFKWRWKKRAMLKFEIVSHLFVLLLSLGTAIASLPLKLYNNAFLWCWISPLPIYCESDDIDGNCERGENALIYRFTFYYFWQFVTWLVLVVAMSLLYHTAWAHAQKMKRYASGGEAAERNRQQILRLSSYYVISFLITYAFPTAARIIQWSGQIPPFSVYLLFVIFLPMQGIWNAIVFLVPRFRSNRSKHPEWTCGRNIKETLMKCIKSTRQRGDTSLDELSESGVDYQASNTATIITHSATKLGVNAQLQDSPI